MFRHLDVSAVCTDDDRVTVNEKEDQVNPHGPAHFSLHFLVTQRFMGHLFRVISVQPFQLCV